MRSLQIAKERRSIYIYVLRRLKATMRSRHRKSQHRTFVCYAIRLIADICDAIVHCTSHIAYRAIASFICSAICLIADICDAIPLQIAKLQSQFKLGRLKLFLTRGPDKFICFVFMFFNMCAPLIKERPESLFDYNVLFFK